MKSTKGISRRCFVKGAATVAAAYSILPGRAWGAARGGGPNSKLNLGFVGVGSQGLRVMLNFLRYPEVQVVSVCDVNQESGDYPQWGETEFRDSVRKTLGSQYATWGDWLSTSRVIELTRTMKVKGGVAGREPCRKIVDAFYAGQKRSGQYQACTATKDFRELLDKDLDGIVVATPDHWHATVAIAAMKKGKHVYCQKPMAHSVFEARRMAEVAAETGVATQVAVGNQASEATRLLCEWIWDGAIGPVHHVVNWSSRPFWPQGLDRPQEMTFTPGGLDWDLWLGPAPYRPFNKAYLPFVWRGWHDFGCGAIGDMGCYSFDTIFRVLKLEAPIAVEASTSESYAETFPKASLMHFDFAARAGMPPVRISWYDGGLKPPRPEEIQDQKLADEGLMFVGDKGAILCGFTGEHPVLIPEAKMRAYLQPAKKLPRSPGHDQEWLAACKGGKERPGANFGFSGLVTETILLGNIAAITQDRLSWDRAALRASNSVAAQSWIRPERRAGWPI